jgi:quercetin dioxygenase-like cupin family protein
VPHRSRRGDARDDVSAHATTILDLSTLLYDAKHVLARKALVHQTDEVQVNVYVLEPGGRIPAHRHSSSWDIAFVIEGEIEARFTEGGTVRTVRCGKQAINLVPPGTVHEIANASTTQPAKFLLIQSPSRSFDFVKSEPPLAN